MTTPNPKDVPVRRATLNRDIPTAWAGKASSVKPLGNGTFPVQAPYTGGLRLDPTYTLADLLLECSSAVRAAPPPTRDDLDDCIAKERAELVRLGAMSPTEAEQAAFAEFLTELHRWESEELTRRQWVPLYIQMGRRLSARPVSTNESVRRLYSFVAEKLLQECPPLHARGVPKRESGASWRYVRIQLCHDSIEHYEDSKSRQAETLTRYAAEQQAFDAVLRELADDA